MFAFVAVYLSYFFRWRADTLSAVRWDHVQFVGSALLVVHLEEAVVKGLDSDPTACFRSLENFVTAAPGLVAALQALFTPSFGFQSASDLMFAPLGSAKNKLDPDLAMVEKSVEVSGLTPDMGSHFKPSYTSHCLRVGTCTVLHKIGVSREAIELWCG